MRRLTADRALVVVLAALCFVWAIGRPDTDPDLGWHLAAGEWIWRHRALPLVDPFGYPTAGVPWLPYSWAAELTFWVVTTMLGAHALAIGCGLLFAATFVVVYATCRGQGAAPLAAIAVTLLGALATYPFYSERPVLFSFFALALCGRLFWRATRGHGGEPAWRYAVLFALWANVHVFFVVGLAWLWAAPLAAAAAGRPWRRLVPIALAASLATLCTPFGFALHHELVRLSGEPITLSQIIEFTSPDFHTMAGGLVLAFILTMLSAFTLAPGPVALLPLAMILGHAALALYMQRNVPLLAIFATPAIARAFTTAFALRLPSRASLPAPDGLIVLRWAAVAMAGLFVARNIPTDPSLAAQFERARYPVGAVRFLQSQPVLGRMFNPFGWGGYLLHELYPTYQVSIDGRTTTYGARNAAYFKTAFVQDGWQGYLTALEPDFVIWQRGAPLAQMLAVRPGWRRVYADAVAVIFVRTDHPLRDRLRTAGRAAAAGEHTQIARPL